MYIPKLFKPDDRVWFVEERIGYTVQAVEEHIAVCSKPFAPRKTTIYTVLDLEEMIRGPEGVVFGIGAETREQCEEMAVRIRYGETEISYRRRIPIKFKKIEFA